MKNGVRFLRHARHWIPGGSGWLFGPYFGGPLPQHASSPLIPSARMQVVAGWAVESVFWPFRPRGSKTPDDVRGADFHGLRRAAGKAALGMGWAVDQRPSGKDTSRQIVGEWLKLTAPPGSPLPEKRTSLEYRDRCHARAAGNWHSVFWLPIGRRLPRGFRASDQSPRRTLISTYLANLLPG